MIKSLIVAVILQMLFVLSVQAEEKAVTMRTMLEGVNMIQLGFLTNTKTLVEDGISEIQAGRKVLETVDRSHYMSFDEVQAHAYTKQKTNKIYMHAVALENKYKAGQTFEAMAEYELLIRQCIECHTKLRDYKDMGNNLEK